MIIKSFEIKKNKSNFLKFNLFLLYGENIGLKKDISKIIKNEICGDNNKTEIISFFEDEILSNQDKLFDSAYSSSLFNENKIIIINQATDKLFKQINDIYNKSPDGTYLILFSNILEKKSKLRNFFEKEKKVICTPCYLDSDKDLEIILNLELKNSNILLSRESINLIIEKSNSDRNNLRNEIEKIKSYAKNKKKIDFDEIKLLINFSGDYKSDILVNDCLSGNILAYKKNISEIYTNSINQILLLRILSNKIQRLLKIKLEKNETNNFENIINSFKPPIFWKEKAIVKKQLLIWKIDDLKKIVDQISNTELLCKKNPLISKVIFFDFFSKICNKASNYSL